MPHSHARSSQLRDSRTACPARKTLADVARRLAVDPDRCRGVRSRPAYKVHRPIELSLGEAWPADSFISLKYTTNSGSAFGLFPNQTTLLIIASFFAVGFLIYFYKTHARPRKLLRLAIGLQLGGAIGNLLDRVRDGTVVDFIDVGPWPTFNIADSSIVVGMAILVAC